MVSVTILELSWGSFVLVGTRDSVVVVSSGDSVVLVTPEESTPSVASGEVGGVAIVDEGELIPASFSCPSSLPDVPSLP